MSRTAITDDRGNYYVEVPVGSYKVTLFFGDLSYEINDVETEAGQVTGVDWVFDPNALRWLEPAQSAKTTLRPGISVEATSP